MLSSKFTLILAPTRVALALVAGVCVLALGWASPASAQCGNGLNGKLAGVCSDNGQPCTVAEDLRLCGAAATCTPVTGPFVVGQKVKVAWVTQAPFNLQLDDAQEIDVVRSRLDCVNSVAPGSEPPFFFCTDEGLIASFQDNEQTTCSDAGGGVLTVTCALSDANTVECTWTDGGGAPARPFLVDQASAADPLETLCAVFYDVTVESLSGMNGDVTPLDIEIAARSEAMCATGGSGAGEGTNSLPLQAECEVQLDRQVSCGGPFVDVENIDDPNNADTKSCSTMPNAPVTVQYVVSNVGNDSLSDCALADSNAALGVNPPLFGLAPFQEISFDTSPICEDVVGGEPGTAVVVCSCDLVGGFVDDEDTANFMCTRVPATSTWGSALLAALLLAILSLWTVWVQPARSS